MYFKVVVKTIWVAKLICSDGFVKWKKQCTHAGVLLLTAANERAAISKWESKIKKFTPWNWTNSETNAEEEAPFQIQVINDADDSIDGFEYTYVCMVVCI